MAIRRRQVHPDETGVVTQEALIQALIEAASWLDFAGGMLEVVTARQPTGFPGEMVTTGAAIEWRDRTDARPQPEPTSTIPSAQLRPEPASNDQPNPEQAPLARLAEDDATLGALDGGVPTEDNPDGFDYGQLDAEDVEAEPEVAR